jgi:hypothetical protein
MNITCILGIHKFKNCMCLNCGRQSTHEWEECKCLNCGKTRGEAHDWGKACEKCAKCGVTRQNAHNWNGCKCLNCGRHSSIRAAISDGDLKRVEALLKDKRELVSSRDDKKQNQRRRPLGGRGLRWQRQQSEAFASCRSDFGALMDCGAVFALGLRGACWMRRVSASKARQTRHMRADRKADPVLRSAFTLIVPQLGQQAVDRVSRVGAKVELPDSPRAPMTTNQTAFVPTGRGASNANPLPHASIPAHKDRASLRSEFVTFLNLRDFLTRKPFVLSGDFCEKTKSHKLSGQNHFMLDDPDHFFQNQSIGTPRSPD